MQGDPTPLLPDVIALAMNVICSVGFILVNKQLMSVSGYDFGFATCLTGIHVAITALMGVVSNTTGPLALKYIPRRELFQLSLIANLSIAGMNLSLMLNSVQFYQISRLSVIPVVYAIKGIVYKKYKSGQVRISVVAVAIGVAVCTITELKDNTEGFLCASVAVLSTSLLQVYMASLQKKYSIGCFDLLSKAAPIQAVSLILLGPFVDYYFTGILFLDNEMSLGAALFILLSYTLAVLSNISQYLCIGRLRSVAFQFRDHMETLFILILGWVLFDSSITLKSILGVSVAAIGSVMYSWATEVENQRLLAINDHPDMVNSIIEEETTLVVAPDTKPVDDTELGEN